MVPTVVRAASAGEAPFAIVDQSAAGPFGS